VFHTPDAQKPRAGYLSVRVHKMKTKIIKLLSALFFLAQMSGSFAVDCTNEKYEPYKGNDKFLCSIKRADTKYSDGLLIAPSNNGKWVGWLYQTVYYAEPVTMKEIYNNCEGLGLVGEHSGNTYTLNIEPRTAKFTGNIVVKKSLKNTKVQGECQILSEDIWSLHLQKSKKNNEP